MRYPKEHKHQTRQRIVTTAGRRLKQDAGLTNGAFYAYFTSEDDLVATAVADQMRAQHESIVAQAAPGRVGLEQIIRWYFSTEQRDAIEDDRPNAALHRRLRRPPWHPTTRPRHA
ncbi:hypothetical protein [Streptomyces acidiscabies]|uniref:hypothetical protein n=1 Tax=Streptomyces acidiscabies TaxID=42234 RepID=UPI0038F6266B